MSQVTHFLNGPCLIINYIQKIKKINKIEKKNQQNRKKIKKIERKKIKNRKEKSLFSVVSDKMCVFCFYPILDSQECVKRGSCRRLILFGLFVLFLCSWDFGPIYVKVRVWALNLPHYVVYFIESLSHFVFNRCWCYFSY